MQKNRLQISCYVTKFAEQISKPSCALAMSVFFGSRFTESNHDMGFVESGPCWIQTKVFYNKNPKKYTVEKYLIKKCLVIFLNP